MHIGIAGVGRMGSSMALRLMEVGHELTIWNRSPDKVTPLVAAGAGAAKTPGELASAVEAIITILTDSNATDAVYHGAQGLLSVDVKGKLFIEMSTLPPDTAPKLAEKVRAQGALFVECPVGGSTAPARKGELLGLIGAEPEDMERAKPILDGLCRRLLHAGPVGSGSVLKLAVNLPLMVYWQALGEQLALVNTLNIDPTELLEFLSETSGAAAALKQRAASIAARFKNAPPNAGTFNLNNGIKDIEAMLNESRRRGIELPLVQRALQCYEEVRRNTSGHEEVSSLPVYWANRNKA